MTQISETTVALRIRGDSLNPEDISTLLGCKGSTTYSKGDIKLNSHTGKKIIRKTGFWCLEAIDSKPENIDAQIAEVLNKITDDEIVWKKLSNDYYLDIFCGIFMLDSNEGMEISSSTLLNLGKRGIVLGLDIYGATDDENA